MTIFQNVAFGPMEKVLPETQRRVEAALKWCSWQVWHVSRQPGGQQQRMPWRAPW
jgi:ABC-type sulfate/molybdate transport systems ATPase subunit